MRLMKFCMFFFNFIFWLSGLTLIIVGTKIHSQSGEYFSYADNNFATAEFFIIIVGLVVFIIGFLGCCGAVKENYCMITAFSVLLSIVFILEIAAGILGYMYRDQARAAATVALKKAMDHYDTEEGAKKLLNWAQGMFRCCGNIGPTDYDVRVGSKMVSPCGSSGGGVQSCHEGGECKNRQYTAGCKEKFISFIRNNMVVIGGVAVGIAFIELAGIIFSCCLMKTIRNEYEVV